MGDPGRPIIPISIGCHSFPDGICDFGASVNIMLKVIYERILNDSLLYTNMHLQFADQSICYPEGVLEVVVIRVGQSYVPVDFVVMETGVDRKALIILGRPFLCTTKAIIYAEHAKIVLSIKDKKERFTFKNSVLSAPAAPKQFYQQGKQEQQATPKKKNNRRWRKTKHAETTQLITTLNTENDHVLPKPCPIKRGDPGVPIIECTINNTTFPYTVYDTRSGYNIMSKQVYDELFYLPLYPNIYSVADGGSIIKIPGRNSQGCNGKNSRTIYTYRFSSS